MPKLPEINIMKTQDSMPMVVKRRPMTESRLYMSGTLRSWIHFIELRSANGTQKEHQKVAIACARVIAEIFPLATDLLAN